jgi:hypothetical protein
MELCREHDYRPEADGTLDPTTLIALFMRQVAAGNVSCDQVRLMGMTRSARRVTARCACACRWG